MLGLMLLPISFEGESRIPLKEGVVSVYELLGLVAFLDVPEEVFSAPHFLWATARYGKI